MLWSSYRTSALRVIYARCRRLPGMKRLLVLLALCASVAVPPAAFAQPAPPMPGGPSPEQRATMEKIRTDAKAAAYGTLTPAHASAVTAIVAQVAAGTLDRRAARRQIDALLTPDEQKAVLAASDKARDAMRAAMGPGGPPRGAGGPPPGAGPPPPGAEPPPGGRFGPPSAGRFLMMVSLSRDQMRSTMPRARSSSAP
jgi:hypothetical protein